LGIASTTTQAMAERHEALWLAVSALHKDSIALGAKRPLTPVSDPVRISAEGLLSDCAPFIRQRGARLPVAAPDLAGLALQLGQALAGLDTWESRHSVWDTQYNCRMWSLGAETVPVLRLKPPAAALARPRIDMADMRQKLATRIDQRQRAIYQKGFAAGLAARSGPPVDPASPRPEEPGRGPDNGHQGQDEQTYPRMRWLG
jgi:hypothetical protein